MKDVTQIKVRCSMLGEIMTESRGGGGLTDNQKEILADLLDKEKRTKKQQETVDYLIAKRDKKPELSETAKSAAVKIFAQWYYGRKYDAYSKFLEKGTQVEEDTITLWSDVENVLYLKNDKMFENDYITGTPDTLSLLDKYNEIPDFKSSWDMTTFLKSKFSDVDKNYWWQLQGYMWLTGANKASVRYGVVNATPKLIQSEKYRLFNSMDVPETNDEFIARAKQIERNMIYDRAEFEKYNPNCDLLISREEWFANGYDIPKEERVFKFEIERDDQAIEQIADRVMLLREFIVEQLMPKVKVVA